MLRTSDSSPRTRSILQTANTIFAGGVMITASHNPANYNGMKFTRDQAQAISFDTGLSAIKERIGRGDFGEPAAKRGTVAHRDILDDFATHCLTFVDPKAIKPFKIAIDAGNGMAGLTVPYVFKQLGCHVFPLFFELDGTFPESSGQSIEPKIWWTCKRPCSTTAATLASHSTAMPIACSSSMKRAV